MGGLPPSPPKVSSTGKWLVAETPKRPPDRLTDSAIGSIPEIETAVFHELATTTLTLVIEPVRSKRPPEYERVCVLCSLFTRNHAQSCDLDFFTRLERLRLIVLFYRFFVALPRGSISSKDFGSSAARDMAINSGDGGHDKPKSHRRLSRGAELLLLLTCTTDARTTFWTRDLRLLCWPRFGPCGDDRAEPRENAVINHHNDNYILLRTVFSTGHFIVPFRV